MFQATLVREFSSLLRVGDFPLGDFGPPPLTIEKQNLHGAHVGSFIPWNHWPTGSWWCVSFIPVFFSGSSATVAVILEDVEVTLRSRGLAHLRPKVSRAQLSKYPELLSVHQSATVQITKNCYQFPQHAKCFENFFLRCRAQDAVDFCSCIISVSKNVCAPKTSLVPNLQAGFKIFPGMVHIRRFGVFDFKFICGVTRFGRIFLRLELPIVRQIDSTGFSPLSIFERV